MFQKKWMIILFLASLFLVTGSLMVTASPAEMGSGSISAVEQQNSSSYSNLNYQTTITVTSGLDETVAGRLNLRQAVLDARDCCWQT